MVTEEDLRKGPLAHFLDSPSLQKHMWKQKLGSPTHFVFALFYLYVLHTPEDAPHFDPLWNAWARFHQSAGTGEHALHRWSDAELEVLEELFAAVTGEVEEKHSKRAEATF